MSDRERNFWPFQPRTSIVASLLILFVLIITLIILRFTIDWPSDGAESTLLLGVFLLSLAPIALVLIDTLIDRGGAVEHAGIKIVFAQAEKQEVPGLTIPANIGVPGQAIMDSGSEEILDALRQATTSDVVIVDLEEGQAWWETRLLVLLSGAVRHNRPQALVFGGTDGRRKTLFQGWAPAGELLPHLLNAHPQYRQIYHTALAAARPWESIEPPGAEGVPPQQPTWVPGLLATRHNGWAFDPGTGLPNPFFAEQLLASELGEKIEMPEQPRTISLVRLEELFRPLLHRETIDESWPSERQLDVFFDSDTPYVAITLDGRFKSLVSRTAVLSSMVGTLVRKK